MTLEELKTEAARLGYRLQKKRTSDCRCVLPSPNPNFKTKDGQWKCIDDYECIGRSSKGYTWCNKRSVLNDNHQR